MEIRIVPQENCPRCGGGEEFGNRTKVGHEDGTWSWRCYNPGCTLRYYNPDTGETEDEPTPEEEEALQEEIRQWSEGITFTQVAENQWQGHLPHGLSLAEWREQKKE